MAICKYEPERLSAAYTLAETKEGTAILNNIFKKHERYKLAISEAAKALKLNLFANENSLSPAITAIKTQNFDAELFRKTIQSKYGIQLAGGQDHLKGKIFRVGHLGFINDQDIISVISAIGLTLFEESLITENDIGKALVIAKGFLNR